MTESISINTATDPTYNYGDDLPPELNAPIRWTLGPANYGENAISWLRQTNGSDVLFVSTPFGDTSNGDYAGSTVTLHLSDGGCSSSGESDDPDEPITIGTSTFEWNTYQYTLVDNISLNSGCTAHIAVTAGIEREPLASSRWISTEGTISVKLGSNTRYPDGQYIGSYVLTHVSTTEPVELTRDFNQGSGVPNPPEKIIFEMQNLHGEDLCGLDSRWC